MNLWKKIKSLFTRKKEPPTLEGIFEGRKIYPEKGLIPTKVADEARHIVSLPLPSEREHQQQIRRLFNDSNFGIKKQPASQTYTQKKVRGLPPRSARNKRMWHSATKEELEEED
jgi:hypothetical protein